MARPLPASGSGSLGALARGVAFADGANVDTLRYMEDPSEDSFQTGSSSERRGRQTEGPATWAEVDTEEIERVAVGIARNAMPSNAENTELASRLEAQAAALEADNTDILGLGHIDTQSLALTRNESAAGQRRSVSRASVVGGKPNLARRSIHPGGPGGLRRQPALAVTSQRGEQGHPSKSALHALRHKVLPSSEEFNPSAYLGYIHADTPVDELQMGRLNLKKDLSERTGQLKSLVKENFDRFISCKNTIDDIHVRLRRTEDDASSTAAVMQAVSESHGAATAVFGGMLDRQAQVDRIKGVLAMLKRYESLFRLPTRIRAATERGDFESVVVEYRKARALTATLAQSSPIWQNLFLEVDKGVEGMAEQLRGVLANPRTTSAEAAAPMRLLLQLQADGAATVQPLNPVKLYLDTQEKHLFRLMEVCAEECAQRLDANRDAPSGAVSDAGHDRQPAGNQSSANGLLHHASGVLAESVHSGTVSSSRPTSHADLPPAAAARVVLISKLAAVMVRHLADLWHLPGEHLAGLAGIAPNLGSLVEDATHAISDLVSALLDTFSTHVEGALEALAQEPGAASAKALGAAVHELGLGCLALKEENGPPVAIAGMQRLLEAASLGATARAGAALAADATALADVEDWDAPPPTLKEGVHGSRVPALLEQAVVRSLEALQRVAAEGTRAGVNTAAVCAPPLRQAFFEAFTSFAVAMDKVSAGVLQSVKDSGTSPDRKLLLLLSNCAHVRTTLVPALSKRFDDLLTADSAAGKAAAQELSADCCADIAQIEAQLLAVYTDAKASALDDALEEYFFGDGTRWDALPAPVGLRDAAPELLASLAAVEAEVRGAAPSVRGRVISELLQHVLATHANIVVEQLGALSKGSSLQLLLELAFYKESLETFLQPPITTMFATSEDILAARFQKGVIAGGPGGVAALSEWVDLKAAEEDVHTALEEAVEEHLTVIRKEMRLLMQCFL